MSARDGTEQVPDTAIGILTDKERDLIEGVDVKDRHKALIISHLCREPEPEDLPPDFGGSVYEASLLVMIYHLIWQLLHLDPPDDEAESDFNGLQDLDMKIADWDSALKFLENLLKETPRLDCCIISLLPEPEEDRSASQKCEQFLDTLLSVRNGQGLSLYFCTLGGSLILERKENVRTWISKEIAEQHFSVGENTYF
ncbi:hypothetical protein ZTR_10282 [Talaromyces verruculosus]|nr:hypothetical protein ZTR_10282 [Talaromyces verruculosus]